MSRAPGSNLLPRDALERVAAGLVLLGVAARLAVVLATDNLLPPDGATTLRSALAVADGGWASLPPIPHPLLPLGLAGGVALGLPAYPLARVLVLTAGLLLVAALGWAGARLGGRRLGWTAAAMAAVFPPLVELSAQVLTESLYLPLVVAGLVLLLPGAEAKEGAAGRSVLAGAGAGLLFGLAYLARPEALAVFTAVVAVVALLRLFRAAPTPTWTALGAAALVFGAVLAGYVAWLHLLYGGWHLSGYQIAEVHQAIDAGGRVPEELAAALADRSHVLYASFHPNPMVRALLVLRRGYLEGVPSLVPPLLMLAAGGGAVAVILRGRRLPAWAVLAAVAATPPAFVALATPLVISRYYLLSAVPALLLTAAGAVHLWREGRRPWALGLLLVLALSLAPDWGTLPTTADHPPDALIEALRELDGPVLSNTAAPLAVAGVEASPDGPARISTLSAQALVEEARASGAGGVLVRLIGSAHHPSWEAWPEGRAGARRHASPAGPYLLVPLR